MARKKNAFNLDEFLKVSPSIPTLLMMLASFIISGILLGLIQWMFGWTGGIPLIGGFVSSLIVSSLFFTLNLFVVVLGILFVFIVEWIVSKSFSKAILAFILFIIFDILPFNFIYPIILIALKLYKGKG